MEEYQRMKLIPRGEKRKSNGRVIKNLMRGELSAHVSAQRELGTAQKSEDCDSPTPQGQPTADVLGGVKRSWGRQKEC